MSTKAKLILGTANMGIKPYGAVTQPLSLNLIEKIMDYARTHGIKILESSEAYGCDNILGNQSFDLIYKVTHPYNLNRILEKLGRSHLMGLMYHHGYDTNTTELQEDQRVLYLGSSVYKQGQIGPYDKMVEVPLNLDNREFEHAVYPCKIVRSVFGRGELLKKYTLSECLHFVRDNPTVHGVVVGVDSVAQLQEVVDAWNSY